MKRKNKQLSFIVFALMALTSASYGQRPENNNEGVINIKGTISDSSGNRLTGVTVQANGTKKTTTTNNNGEFQLPGIKRNSLLTFSMVGFKSMQIKASDSIAVTLQESITKLDEVVVTGFQRIDRKSSPALR